MVSIDHGRGNKSEGGLQEELQLRGMGDMGGKSPNEGQSVLWGEAYQSEAWMRGNESRRVMDATLTIVLVAEWNQGPGFAGVQATRVGYPRQKLRMSELEV